MHYFRCTVDGCEVLFETVSERERHEAYDEHCQKCGISKRTPNNPLSLSHICTDCWDELDKNGGVARE